MLKLIRWIKGESAETARLRAEVFDEIRELDDDWKGTLLNGTTAPANTLGRDGDFYIDTTAKYVYGPKAAGVWPAGVSIVGPTGATGPQGPAADVSGLEKKAYNTWLGTGVIDAVVGLLAWKNNGNNHVIFDASNSTKPNGNSCSNKDPDYEWTGSYPTLMGFNGASTFGVRVHNSKIADYGNCIRVWTGGASYNNNLPWRVQTGTGYNGGGNSTVTITVQAVASYEHAVVFCIGPSGAGFGKMKSATQFTFPVTASTTYKWVVFG